MNFLEELCKGLYFYKHITINVLVLTQTFSALTVILKTTVVSLFMAMLLYFVSFETESGNTLVILSGKIVLGIIVYNGAFIILKTFSPKEIGYLKKAFS